ncbi:hypothetical protein CKAH01_14218 [Colletotrichum kahawae]|uniref:Uncharacterized protein n=1 Tax=Colletotrichum kahawae TaxID=34407 RepID=A0AAD9YPF8_COLKA|nr:hypothetical protein CKAH01_14218 [Colletotrichum kahawae]
MPTVIRPHPEVVGKCSCIPSPNRDFFKQISAEDQSREPIQSSVSSADDGTIVACQNGFVYSVLRAWKQHLHLELRPDDVWLAVLVQFSFFINGPGRAEALRNHFLSHEGQRALMVEVGPGKAVNSFDMAAITEHFVVLLRKHLVDPNLADWMLPTFSTTLPRDRSTAAAVFLGTMKQYFDYNVRITCGFPSITLLGEASDWVDLARRVTRLAEFNADTLDRDGSSISEWSRCLVIVVEWMVASFDRPDEVDVRDFWTHACHSGGEGMSGGVVHLSGWLTTFCWWRTDGTRQKVYRDEELAIEYSWRERNWERLHLSAVGFPVIDQGQIPTGLTRVPITFEFEEERFGKEGEEDDKMKMVLLAGSSGMKLLDSQGRRASPFSSWWLLRSTPSRGKVNTRSAVASTVKETSSQLPRTGLVRKSVGEPPTTGPKRTRHSAALEMRQKNMASSDEIEKEET